MYPSVPSRRMSYRWIDRKGHGLRLGTIQVVSGSVMAGHDLQERRGLPPRKSGRGCIRRSCHPHSRIRQRYLLPKRSTPLILSKLQSTRLLNYQHFPLITPQHKQISPVSFPRSSGLLVQIRYGDDRLRLNPVIQPPPLVSPNYPQSQISKIRPSSNCHRSTAPLLFSTAISHSFISD